jgi:hypothetical protein
MSLLPKNYKFGIRQHKFSVSPRPKSNLRSPSSSRRKLRVKFSHNNSRPEPKLTMFTSKNVEDNNLDIKMGSFIEGTRKGALKNALMNVNQRL